jgi:hypothetical protein
VRPNKPTYRRSARPPNGGRPHRLFYFEGDGPQARLRFTRLAVILVVCLTVVPASAIFALFLLRNDPAKIKVDVNVRTLPPVGASPTPLIKQPLPPPPIKPLSSRPLPVPAPSPPSTQPASAETSRPPPASLSNSGAQRP